MSTIGDPARDFGWARLNGRDDASLLRVHDRAPTGGVRVKVDGDTTSLCLLDADGNQVRVVPPGLVELRCEKDGAVVVMWGQP